MGEGPTSPIYRAWRSSRTTPDHPAANFIPELTCWLGTALVWGESLWVSVVAVAYLGRGFRLLAPILGGRHPIKSRSESLWLRPVADAFLE